MGLVFIGHKGKIDIKFLKKLINDNKINFNFFGINNVQPIWGQDFLNEISKQNGFI